MKKGKNRQLIFMAGGGSAGHVYPNIALMKPLKEAGIDYKYLGRHGRFEDWALKDLDIELIEVNAARLHRSFDWELLIMPFRNLKGIFQAVRAIRKYRPGAIFCKGGFGSVPVALGGWLTKTPVILHESDMTLGLANKICSRFSTKVCVTFEETLKELPVGKGVFTGVPIRESLKEGRGEEGLRLAGLDGATAGGAKPVLLVVGGSLGAEAVNLAVWDNLDALLEHFRVIHITGSDQSKHRDFQREGYYSTEYAGPEMPHFLAAADLVLSRAGSTAIHEFLLLKKPAVLVPFPKGVSRGDQEINARNFEKQGFSYTLEEKDLTPDSLLQTLLRAYDNRAGLIEAMSSEKAKDGTKEVVTVIKTVLACET